LITPKPAAKLTLVDLGKGKLDDDTVTMATGLSTLTPGSGLTGLSTRSGTFMKNTTVDPALQSLLPAGIKTADLVGSDPVPTNDDNHPICLSYHIRGGCFSNCHRKENHSRPLSATDKAKLSNWMVDQVAKFKAKFNLP
jgi:hypothetical protein